MGKSLGDYNIERSSSFDINNIKWTQKNPVDADKLKSKKPAKNTSPSNIIYAQNTQTISEPIEKIFKIENSSKTDKLKNKKKNSDKKFQTSSASNCNIEPGFTRKAR